MQGTSAAYVLLPMESRSAAVTGNSFPTGRRTRWALDVAVAEIVGQVTLLLQVRSGANTAWRTVLTKLITAVGSQGWSTREGDFTIQEYDLEIRAVTTGPTGAQALAATSYAPFLDPAADSPDTLLLMPALQEYSQVERVVEEAEDDVLNRPGLGRDPLTGRLQYVTLDDPRFPDQMKLAIARQAERRFLIEQLRASRETDALERLSKIAPVSLEVDDLLAPFIVPPIGPYDPEIEAELQTSEWLAWRGR